VGEDGGVRDGSKNSGFDIYIYMRGLPWSRFFPK
jgi:hypothetical protein